MAKAMASAAVSQSELATDLAGFDRIGSEEPIFEGRGNFANQADQCTRAADQAAVSLPTACSHEGR